MEPITDQFVQLLLQQTNGSPMERERVAAQVRDAIMAAAVPAASTASVNMAAPFVRAGIAEARPATVTAPAAMPKFEGFRDLQSPQEFLDKVENFCVAADIPTGDRVRRVIATALEGSAKLWYRFAGPFESWDGFAEAFKKEFASIDEKLRLKQELDERTQHPQENLREFIYVVAAYYERIGENVLDSEKVDRVLRQMHPDLQDLAAGSTFKDLKELAAAADGLMERARRRQQYRPPPPKTNQVARDLAYTAPGVSNVATMSQHAVSFVGAGAPACAWPLHPAAVQPSYHRDRWPAIPPSGALPQQPAAGRQQIVCRRCGGVGHIARNCATGRPQDRGVCFLCRQPGHFQAQCPGNWRQ